MFRKLAGLTREELLRDLPEAINGIPLIEWEKGLVARGLDTLPCAHLIRRSPHHHWISEDHTGIHDPDPKFPSR